MTTNKPEVKRYELESGYDSMMRRVNRMRESDGGVYVRFDDYEALQAECEKLRKDAQRYRWLREHGRYSGKVLVDHADMGRVLRIEKQLDDLIDSEMEQQK